MSERTVRPMKMIVSILGRGQGNAFVRLLTGKHIFFPSPVRRSGHRHV